MNGNKADLISIIMPCYNRAQLIPESIESALNQTYKNIELVIVDDGSTDNSMEVLESFKKRNARVRVFRQENKGPYAARNRGLKESNGAFVAFLDSDDTWDKTFLEKLHKALELNPGSMLAYCGWQKTGNPKSQGPPYVPPKYESLDIVEWFLKNCPFHIGAVLMRKIFVEKLGGFSTIRLGEDYDLWLRSLTLSRNIVLVPEVLAFYRWHDGVQESANKWKLVVNAWRVRLDFVRNNPSLVAYLGRKRLRELVDGSLLNEGYAAYWKRDLITARRLFRKAFIVGFWEPKDLKYLIPSFLPEKIYCFIIRLLDCVRRMN